MVILFAGGFGVLKPVLMFAAAITAVAVFQGCAKKPSISEADVTDVLSMAVFAAAKKLPPTFCLEPKLEPSSVIWPDHPGSEGWYDSAGKPELKYRRVPSPPIKKIPDSALSAFSNGVANGDCRHKLVFQKPEFVEAKSADYADFETVIFFYDPCPTCGASYTVGLTKRPGKSWVMDPAGITVEAVS